MWWKSLHWQVWEVAVSHFIQGEQSSLNSVQFLAGRNTSESGSNLRFSPCLNESRVLVIFSLCSDAGSCATTNTVRIDKKELEDAIWEITMYSEHDLFSNWLEINLALASTIKYYMELSPSQYKCKCVKDWMLYYDTCTIHTCMVMIIHHKIKAGLNVIKFKSVLFFLWRKHYIIGLVTISIYNNDCHKNKNTARLTSIASCRVS